jgi:hypothetical protein
MADDNDVVDWRRLREFADVDIEASFVLSWQYESGTLFIDVDILLLPDHPFYEKPRPKEKICIRPAIIEFPFCEKVLIEGVQAGEDTAATVDKLGHGAIGGLRLLTDGCYEIAGQFGTVRIESERPLLRLKSA